MNLKKILLAVATLGMTASLRAANINYEVEVAGYSKAGWIEVHPELRGLLGGRVAYLPQYGGWVTDRVSRGETVRVSITPSNRIERRCSGSLVGVAARNSIIEFGFAYLPISDVSVVSMDPNFDNVEVFAYTEAGLFEKRVPIGTRPR